MTCVELEREIAKLAMAMMTQNSQIGKALISHLKAQLTTEAVAGIVIISIERVLWFDPNSVLWTVNHLLPADIYQEIQNTFLVHFYKQLINKGFVPGKDFSIDAKSQLLLNSQAKMAMFSNLIENNLKTLSPQIAVK
ncbi:hypothetical protein [Chroococcidiopsis sp. TS-821]|uniref:hypothetical protein n=1 Tax=Chroococcidiopsis sp. TS-821 TaxID=1378066 RepID=UPI000CEDAEAA|nr:hypothetical protein [Chroococcidiopsis sp. TS-821]PPS45274.1 hypothetical protein B1A85_03160 [Chroococcidiopsis sp. TS-821]